MHIPYVGSGPYCYSNSFAMLMGEHAPPTAVIETLTGGPFGMQLLAGKLPFFDPYGWDPSEGFDNVLSSLGWTSTVTSGGEAADALARLREAVAKGPVWVGPVEMGHLHHQPGMTGPIGADHYVVVLAVDDDTVLMHDPQGFPYATLPLADFMTAWAKETVAYGDPYTLRTDFARLGEVGEVEALRAGLATATSWLHLRDDVPVPPGTLGNGEAAEALAVVWAAGPDEGLRGHLEHFAIRVGARRLDDAATCLARLDLAEASSILREQARLVGALQYPAVKRDDDAVAAGLRELAPTYDRLRAVLSS
ncbi:hypothetical protein AB0I28_30195 [Phytomonospora sp. NPDC050363]|uniref:hypothetical protein n=1 Tax=Phytomonospora sp. NPDC050363 TaxID=3155642 RepID=UPI00340230B9